MCVVAELRRRMHAFWLQRAVVRMRSSFSWGTTQCTTLTHQIRVLIMYARTRNSPFEYISIGRARLRWTLWEYWDLLDDDDEHYAVFGFR